MASFTGSALKDVYKDILHTSNSNTGLSTTIKQITCGDGDGTSLYLSTRNAKVQPASDTTTNTVIYDADGNALFTVDSTNDLVKAGIGQHTINTQTKTFGVYDFSPSTGAHHALISQPIMYSNGGSTWSSAANGTNWGGTGTNPATSLTLASAGMDLVAVSWLLQSDITIQEVQYLMSSNAASTVNIHVMQYDMVTGAGSTAGDLTSGVVLAQTGSAADSLTPITTGDDSISNGTLTINTANVDDGKAIIVFAEASDTDDFTIQINMKYNLR